MAHPVAHARSAGSGRPNPETAESSAHATNRSARWPYPCMGPQKGKSKCPQRPNRTQDSPRRACTDVRRDGQTGAQRRGGPEARSQRRIADRATASRCVPLGGEIRLGSRCLAPSELRVGVRARRARTRTGGAAICTCLVPLGQHVLQRPTRCTGIGGQKVSRIFRIHDRITADHQLQFSYMAMRLRSYVVESILKIVHLIASLRLRVYALPFYQVGALTAHRPAPPHATCPASTADLSLVKVRCLRLPAVKPRARGSPAPLPGHCAARSGHSRAQPSLTSTEHATATRRTTSTRYTRPLRLRKLARG